jgi:hypothetical protein
MATREEGEATNGRNPTIGSIHRIRRSEILTTTT